MNSVKKIFVMIMMVTFLVSNFSMARAVSANNNAIVYRGGEIKEINEKYLEYANFNLYSAGIKEDTAFIEGDLMYNNTKYKLKMSGIIYNSVIEYQKANTIVIDCSDVDNNDFNFLSVQIEENAKKELLQFNNLDLAGKVVTRIALQKKDSKDIVYFEGEFVDSETYKKLKNHAVDVNTVKDNGLADEVRAIEMWYIPFLEKHEAAVVIEDKKNDKEKINSDIQEEIKLYQSRLAVGTKSVSMPDIPYANSDDMDTSIFTNTGVGYLEKDSNIFFGYYKDSYKWPAGSGNIVTNFIQWEYQEDYPRSSSQDEVFLSVKVITSNSYIYNVYNSTISLWDNISYLQLDDVSVGMSVKYANDEYFYMRRFKGDTGGTTYHPIKAFLAGCPYVSNFYWAWSELINDQNQSLNGSEETWPTSKAQQEDSGIFGADGVNRGIGGKCTEYLRNEGQYFKIDGKLHDYGTSSKKIYYHPKFSVYCRNGWGVYSVLGKTFDFSYYISYYR